MFCDVSLFLLPLLIHFAHPKNKQFKLSFQQHYTNDDDDVVEESEIKFIYENDGEK